MPRDTARPAGGYNAIEVSVFGGSHVLVVDYTRGGMLEALEALREELVGNDNLPAAAPLLDEELEVTFEPVRLPERELRGQGPPWEGFWA
jgi:hypothetical protein